MVLVPLRGREAVSALAVLSNRTQDNNSHEHAIHMNQRPQRPSCSLDEREAQSRNSTQGHMMHDSASALMSSGKVGLSITQLVGCNRVGLAPAASRLVT